MSPLRMSLLVSLGLAMPLDASATTLVSVSTESIARKADRVVYGRVIATEVRWRGRRIVTRVRLRPEDGSGSELWFEHPGGTIDGITMRVVGMPVFRPGMRLITLLARRRDEWFLVGMREGAIEVHAGARSDLVELRTGPDMGVETVELSVALARLRGAR